jgi:nitroreductase
MELIDAVTGRRSIRKYKPDQLPDEDVRFILEAARWAPSWANTQCWEFVLVTEPEKKKLLAECLPDQNPARPACEQAPIVIAACARKGVSGFFKGQSVTDKGDWMMFDTALAVQNLTLAAHAKGLGTVHVGFFDAQVAAAALQVPSDVAVIELIPLGYPAQEGKQTPRKPLEECVFYNTYGTGTP